jgi:hypothetical protein
VHYNTYNTEWILRKGRAFTWIWIPKLLKEICQGMAVCQGENPSGFNEEDSSLVSKSGRGRPA